MQRSKRGTISKLIILFDILIFTAWTLLKILYRQKFTKISFEETLEAGQKWSQKALEKVGYEIEIRGEVPMTSPGVFVGNHVSFLDIPLIWACANVTFVSKKEVGDWPIFGPGAKAVGTILVDRNSYKSRRNVLVQMAQEIRENKKRVAIFPEGTSSILGKAWKWGAFSLAEKEKFPLQGFCLSYQPLRDSAYIDQDRLIPQIWKILDHPRKKAIIEFSPPREVKDVRADCLELQSWCQKSFQNINGTED